MAYDIMDVIQQITKDKNLDYDYVLETVKDGLLQAAKKKYGHVDNVRIEVDKKENDLYMIATKRVVDEVDDWTTEISLEDAREIDAEADIDDEMEIEIPFEEFGRGAIGATKTILVQRIREKEREQVYNDYSNRIGELVTGTVQQMDKNGIFVTLGQAEAIVPAKEQIPRERYRQGDRIRCIIMDVQRVLKGPQVILSRASDSLLERLYELEVPEIFERIIEIKAIAREPGERSKIAVLSHDARVDPVGACVGVKGVRVQAIVRELANERIDIVHWDPDPEIFVTRALAPATVVQITTNEEERAMEVVVDDEKLSLAIGRNGQNARLAAKLTGWRITVISESQYLDRKSGKIWEEDVPGTPLNEFEEITDSVREKLEAGGVDSIEKLSSLAPNELEAIDGIGPKTAAKLSELAQVVLAQRRAEDEGEDATAEVPAEAPAVESDSE